MQLWEYTLKKGVVNEGNVNYLQDMVVFPSKSYNMDMKVIKNLIECFIFSSNVSEKFSNPIFSYIEPIIDNGAYVTINMVSIDTLQEKKESTTLGKILANFIVSTDFAPFLVHKKKLLLPVNPEIKVENKNLGMFWNQKTIDDVELNVGRFVDYQNRINPLLFFLENFEWESERQYQTEKFKNAVTALKFVISRGFPHKEIIDWNRNQITDKKFRKELIMGDADIDYQFIQGNVEIRFCKLVRFALKIFIQNRDKLIDELTKFGEAYKNSALYLFVDINPFIENYIPSKVLIKEYNIRNKLEYNKIQEMPELLFKHIKVIMQNVQPSKDFTSIFLDRFSKKYRSSTLFGGFKCKLEGSIKAYELDMKKYYITLYFDDENGIPLSKLPETLIDIKLKMRSEIFDTLKSIDKADFIQEMQKTGNSVFWLYYVDVIVPHNNEEMYKICKKIFDYNFRFEQKYAHRVRRITSHTTDKKMDVFELAFPKFFDISIDKFYYEPHTKLNKADMFTVEAVTTALSGDLHTSATVLLAASEILDADYEFLKGYKENKSQFKDYDEYEEWLKEKKAYPNVYSEYDKFLSAHWAFLPHFDKKPILCHNVEEYKEMKEINEHFRNSFHQFVEIDKKRNTVLRSTDTNEYFSSLYEIRDIFQNLGIYKRKDLKYLEDILNNLKLKLSF